MTDLTPTTAARFDVGGPGVAGGSTDDGPTTVAPRPAATSPSMVAAEDIVTDHLHETPPLPGLDKEASATTTAAGDAAYAHRIWGDDAMFCEFDRAWHHREYHEHNGYETQAIRMDKDESEFEPHPQTAQVPGCYLDRTDLIFVHRCDWPQFGGARLRKTVLSQERWRVHQTEDGELTVTPSIACTACHLHGFFAAGVWRDV